MPELHWSLSVIVSYVDAVNITLHCGIFVSV